MSHKLLLALFGILYGVVGLNEIQENNITNNHNENRNENEVYIDSKEEWNIWKGKYNKTYSGGEEEEKRFENWKDNIIEANRHNSLNKSWRKGLNKFSDMTLSEFKSKMLRSIPVDTTLCDRMNNQSLATTLPSKTNEKLSNLYNTISSNSRKENRKLLELNNKILPAYWDWQAQGAVGPVRDQGGQCGSCYAFATTGAIEGLSKIVTGVLYTLSVAEIVDCSTPYGNLKCNGGEVDQSFEYVKYNGLCLDSSYPYDGRSFNCIANTCKSVINISGCASLRTGDLYISELLLEYAVNLFPVAVNVDASCLFSYVSGVIDDESCYESINHSMLLVGYSRVLSPVGYWRLRNSWGTSHGEDGYVRIAMNRNIIGIVEAGSVPTMNIPIKAREYIRF